MQPSIKILLILLSSCSLFIGCEQAEISVDSLNPKDSINSNFPNLTMGNLEALYASSSLWLDYTKSDVGTEYNATGTSPCDGTETSARDCIHAGEMKAVTITGTNSCDGITAVDDLGVFTWKCFVSGAAIRVYSTLKSDKGLKDLLNASSWKSNSLSVLKNNNLISKTSSSTWWTNTVTPYTPIATPQDFITPNMIYTVSGAASFGGFRMNSDQVAIVGLGASYLPLTYLANNVCGNTGAAGTSDCGVSVPDTGVKYNWIENFNFNMAASPNYGLLVPGAQYFNFRNLIITGVSSGTGIHLGVSGTPISKFNRFYNIDIVGNSSAGLYINHANSSYNYFEHILVDSNGSRGIDLSNATGNEFKMITARNNTSEGIRISSAHKTKLTSFSIERNTGTGLTISNSNDVKFSQGDVINNGSTGISVGGTSQRTVGYQFKVSNCSSSCFSISSTSTTQDAIYSQFIVTNSNAGSGGITFNGYTNTMTHFISANNAGDGYYTTSGRNPQSAFSQGIFANNGGQGFEGASSTTISKWHNVAFIGNGSHGFWNAYSPEAHMYGQFIVGNNVGDKCAAGQSVTGKCTASGTDGSTDWTNQGDSNAYLRINHNLLDSFYGEVTADSYNQTATLVEEQNNITDWTSFENVFRIWGLAGATTNHLQTDQRGFCTGGGVDCRVWDWRLVPGATDNVLFNRSGNYTAGDQVNEVFVGDGITNCPGAVHGDITMINSFTAPLTYLVNALEISDDDIGNDNSLCESGESCIYSPNIGPYQGEGNYLTNGTCNFVDGVGSNAVSNITMHAYPTNGAL